MRILVIEDDDAIRGFIVRGLTEEGFSIDEAGDGSEGRFKLTDPAYDLVILDVMLPHVDGLALLKELRCRDSHVPVLLLTAKDTVADRVRGLDHGADDYLVKPFAFDEFLARVRAVLRRARTGFSSVLTNGKLVLNRTTRKVTWNQTALELSPREFAILEFFMQHPGEVLTRTRMYEHVWNEQSEGMSNVIDVHVKELRRKLARAGSDPLITTLRGAGYRLEGSA